MTIPPDLAAAGNPDDPRSTRLDSLELPEVQQQVLRWITQQRSVSLTALAAHLELAPADAAAVLTPLLTQGLVEAIPTQGEPQYRVRTVTRKGRVLPTQIWESLEDSDP